MIEDVIFDLYPESGHEISSIKTLHKMLNEKALEIHNQTKISENISEKTRNMNFFKSRLTDEKTRVLFDLTFSKENDLQIFDRIYEEYLQLNQNKVNLFKNELKNLEKSFNLSISCTSYENSNHPNEDNIKNSDDYGNWE